MLKLGLPSKGRLQEDAIRWFERGNITIRRTGSGREYAGRVEGIDGVELVLLSAGEIPRELNAGRIHMGVTGQDLVHEKLPHWRRDLVELAEMGFGHADLIVAVPSSWVDVETMDDLDQVAAAFRATHGHRLRVATKYHALVRTFFRREGVADYRIVDSQGATEGTIKNATAEAIADITSSGETLRANHLKILRDGLILASQATLFLSQTAQWGAAERAALVQLCAQLGLTAPAPRD
ncbi:ATP phosphoribosyltransferase [Rubricella aquisinus]|uniref:ATP phosphoribosyltransferase n=2 Tax=Rubricella aquisinus TaxID=2028108 RepID=A0A840WXM3_9RHOB|nr:ATP phosphoribosyltransferase [Rubricella aquisinus]MBB5515114.1 ATP phosphoribosyltransferase [Rubricella aquisinus]